MPRKYPHETRLEAVALSRLAGADVAARQLGIDVRTVREWLGEAGDPPELRAPGDRIAAIFDAATSRVMSALASGRLSPRDSAVVAGIMKRNMDRPRPAEPERPAEEIAAHALVARLDELYPGQTQLALVVLIDHLEHGGDADAWAAERVDLDAWRAARSAEHEAINQRAARAAMYARQGLPAAECWARAEQPPELPPDVLALVDRAEQLLEETA